MYAMVVQGGTEPAQRDEMNTAVKERLIPALLAEPGFRGAVNLENETNGHGMMLTLWDTKEQATRIPDSAARQDAMTAIMRVSTGLRAPISVWHVNAFHVEVAAPA